MATKGRDERQAAGLEAAQAEAGAKGAQLGEHADEMAAIRSTLGVADGDGLVPHLRALLDRTALLEETQTELQAARLDLRVRVEQLAAALELASHGGAEAQKRAEELEKEVKGLRKELGMGEGPPLSGSQPGSAWLIEARSPTGRPLEMPFYRARGRGKGPALWTHDAAAAERFGSAAAAWDAITAQLDAAAGPGFGRMVPACHGFAR
jgi:hypothetical protein